MFLTKQLFREKYVYVTSCSVKEFKDDLQKLFNEKWYEFFVNLNGEFKTVNEFVITKKMTFTHSSYGNSYTKLKGKINFYNNQTIINITVIPNPIVYVFTIIPPLVGVLMLYNCIIIDKENQEEKLIVGIFFTLIVPIATAFYGQAAKNDLRKKFTEIFKLKNLQSA